MKRISMGNGVLDASQIVLGCMRLNGLSKEDANKHIMTAIDLGIDFFDHADIYGGGYCETLFSEAIDLTPSLREKILIQSKCAITNGYYDFSKEHILKSVDGILQRLNTEYLDVLLLHRPDTLMEPKEVAEAFTILHNKGKVRNFGVSNQNSMQIELLSRYLDNRLIANQLQLSITNTGIIDSGLCVNTKFHNSIDHDGSILEYCRLSDITIQAWSPFQFGFFEGVFVGNEKFPEINAVLARLAEEKSVTPSAIAIAWILRHPAKMQAIVGTMNTPRLIEICKAADIELTRSEWYEIYKSAGNILP